MENNYKHIVAQVNESFRINNPDVFTGFCREDAVWNILGDQILTGKKAITDFMEPMRGCNPADVKFYHTVQEGEKVVSTGSMIMPGKDGTNTEMMFSDLYVFEDGLIREITSYIVELKK